MVCRGNYSKRALDDPLLFDLHHDPGEIYPLDTKIPMYTAILEKITSVSGWSHLGDEVLLLLMLYLGLGIEVYTYVLSILISGESE